MPWLCVEYGFAVVEDQYSPESFGDSLVILESSTLRLQIIRDRGQLFTQVASKRIPEMWFNLEDLCALIAGHPISMPLDVKLLSNVLRIYLSSIVERLSGDLQETHNQIQAGLLHRPTED